MLTEKYLRAVKVDPLGVGKESVEGWCPVLVTKMMDGLQCGVRRSV